MKQKLAPLYVLGAGSLWGLMGMFVRHFNDLGLGSLEIGELRMIMGLVVTGGYLAIFHRELLKIRWRDLWCFAGTGIGSLLLMNWTYFTAMEHTSLAVAGVLLYTAPIFVMLLSALLFRETITKRKVFVLLLAFSGCAMVSGIGTDNQISALGLIYGLGAGISYAMYSIFGRFAIRRGYGSWTITFYSFLFCAAAGAFVCDWHVAAAAVTEPVWIVLLGVVTAFAPYVLYSLGLTAMENSRASILASIEPVVATLISVFVFHEPMGVLSALGMGLVLTAIVLLANKN